MDASRGRKPGLSPLGSQQQQREKKGRARRVLGLQLPGSSAKGGPMSARLRSTSTLNMAMLCIPSANLELLSALQQDMHGYFTHELDLVSWDSVNEAIQKSTASNTIVIVGIGTRWSRPCRVLFSTLNQAVVKYRELTVGVSVQLLLVDHETSTGIDLERIPIGVPATFVFVRGVPILFSRPVADKSAPPSAQGTGEFGDEEENINPGGDDERDDIDEDDDDDDDKDDGQNAERASSFSPASLTRKCMTGTLSIAQAEFLVEHSVSAASRVIKSAPSCSQSVSSPIVDLYEDLDSPFAQELRVRRR